MGGYDRVKVDMGPLYWLGDAPHRSGDGLGRRAEQGCSRACLEGDTVIRRTYRSC